MSNSSQPASYSEVAPVTPAKPDTMTIMGKVLCIVGILFGSITAILGLIPGIGLVAFGIAFPAIFFSGMGAIVLKTGQRGGAKLGLIGIGLALFGIVVQIIELVAISKAPR